VSDNYSKDYARSSEALTEAIKQLPDAENTDKDSIHIAVFAPEVMATSDRITGVRMHTLVFDRTRFTAEKQVWWDWTLRA